MSSEKKTIALTGGKPWGFRLAGGFDRRTVFTVLDTTNPKSKNAGLKADQIIYSINGVYTGNLSHQDAKDLIIKSGETLSLEIIESKNSNYYKELIESISKSSTNQSGKSETSDSTSSGLKTVPKSLPTSQESLKMQKPTNNTEPPKNTVSYGLGSNITKEESEQLKKKITESTEKINTKSDKKDSNECIYNDTGLTSTTQTKSPFMKALEKHVEADMADGPIYKNSGVTNIEPVTYLVDVDNTASKALSSKESINNNEIKTDAKANSNFAKSGPLNTPNSITSNSKPVTSKPGMTVPFPSGDDKINVKSTITVPADSKKIIDQDSKPEFITDKKSCDRCKMLIEEKVFLKSNDLYYHKQHFNCRTCGKSLVDSGHVFDTKLNDIFCQNCVDTYMLGHDSNAAKEGREALNSSDARCFKCNKILSDQFVNANQKNYHKQCFVCQNCSSNLVGKPFLMDMGKHYCSPCFGKLFSEKCSRCNNAITPGESFLKLNEKSIHSTCFTCFVCNNQLKAFKYRDNQPICPHH